MFTLTVFITANIWNVLRCPFRSEQIKRLQYDYKMEHYSTVKNWLPHTDTAQKVLDLGQQSQTKTPESKL